MRRLVALLSVLGLALVLSPAKAGTPGPGFVKTDNVGYVASVPLDADTAGGRLLGKTFYVLTAKGLTIYDVSNPTLPLPLGFTPLPHTPSQEREDVDTNGKILVAGQSYIGILYVVDVSNPRVPTLLATLEGGADHTNTCAMSCTWVYGSEGTVVDLRDPRNPKIAGNSGIDGHDLTEIRPGFLITATTPITYIDVRRNPVHPKELADADSAGSGYYNHSVHWPRGGADRWLMNGTEVMLCSDPALGSFQVFDTQGWQKKGFRHVSTYTLEQGLQTDGKSPVNEFCAHWFEPHPTFRNGGVVAIAWYGFGIRFLNVTPKGQIQDLGYFVPLPGHHSSVYWISPTVLYALDYTARGFDILTFDPKKAAGERDPRAGRVVPVKGTPQPYTGPKVEASYLCRPVDLLGTV